ncbi:tetratricopeptide repeat protein [Occallatibacter savannae]|uniref:tetratricopeptide repeat protein n=1 Tax=Occallatibacter savannae TaxID=1002691 RepID=UPI0013A54DD9|nr:tetratricopeptide repeat protein [Occallatibacter savannae]
MNWRRTYRPLSRFGLLISISPVLSLAQTPVNADDPRQTAIQFEQQGDAARAQEAWQSVLKLHPRDAEAFAHLGLLEAHLERYEQAIGHYEKAMSLNPEMPGLRLNLGLALFKAGRMKEAAANFLQLLKELPADSQEATRLNTLIGLARYGSGDYAGAVPFLKKAVAADSQNLPFRMTLAQSCLWSKQYRCVLDVYHEIVNLNENSAEADMLAGQALDEMKDRPGAIEQFRAAVQADPKMPDVHFGLGYLLWAQLKFDEAAKELQAELNNSPDHAQAMAYLADCYIQSNTPEPALPLLEKAVRLNPKLELAHVDLGVLYANAGKDDDALRELKTAERLDPGDQNVHWRLGRFYKSVGKKAEAEIEFQKTRSLQKAADKSIFDKLHSAQEKHEKESASSPTTN